MQHNANRFTSNYQGIDLNDKIVLITGGTGSFGKQFVKTCLARYNLKKLIIFSRDEQKHFDMQEEFSAHSQFKNLRFFIGDVRDSDRLDLAVRDVDYVIHAAALKHVPAAEYNPFECIKTNVLGTQNVVMACLKNHVKKAMMVSTDKAANPINLYGASKLAAEKIFTASNNLSGSLNTRFGVVRYGNVIGSRGSVIPLFKRLIERNNDHLPITDTRMTRFWISLEEGVDFVLSATAMSKGGEIFIPKIPSMKIIDIAAHLGPHLKHKVVGIRAGEKLHEVLLTQNEAIFGHELEDRYIVRPVEIFSDRLILPKTAKKLDENFCYTSDSNDWWLTGHEVDQMEAA